VNQSNLRSNRIFITLIYYLAFIGLGLTGASFGPTLQGLATNTRSTLAQISSLFLIRSFGYLLGSINGGRVYDRVKGHPVMAGSLLAMALMMIFAPLANMLWVLGGLIFILGFAEGMLDVGTNTLIVWVHGDRVPPFMSGLHAFFGVGTTVAPLFVAWALTSFSMITPAYWLVGFLILPVSLVLFFLPSPKSIHSSSDLAERPIIPVLVFLAAVMFFLYVGAEVGFAGWIFTYTTSQSIATPAVAAGINSAFWGAFTVGRFISIPLATRLKPSAILWIDLVGCALCVLPIILFPQVLWVLWVGAIGTGLFMASIFPTILNDAQSRMAMTGKITSWFFVGASLGGMILPWLMGQLIAPFGIVATMVVVFVAIVLAAVVYGLLEYYQRTLLPHPDTTRLVEGE
jgi:MFS transporter, FHS family, Na+ dependent glucose transporter 1